MSPGDPGDFERWGRSPEEIFGPGGRWDGRVWEGGHAGVALEGAGVVDGEEEEDVTGGGVGGFEEGEVLFLGRPCALSMWWIRGSYCRGKRILGRW